MRIVPHCQQLAKAIEGEQMNYQSPIWQGSHYTITITLDQGAQIRQDGVMVGFVAAANVFQIAHDTGKSLDERADSLSNALQLAAPALQAFPYMDQINTVILDWIESLSA
jgi:hypothetical protein